MQSISVVWERIKEHQNETFTQKLGGTFTYLVRGEYVIPDRTNHRFPRKHFEEALILVPLRGPAEINHLRGPSYLYAILMDPRIRQNEW